MTLCKINIPRLLLSAYLKIFNVEIQDISSDDGVHSRSKQDEPTQQIQHLHGWTMFPVCWVRVLFLDGARVAE